MDTATVGIGLCGLGVICDNQQHRVDPEEAGEDAADELDEEGTCPAEENGHGPNCQERVRQCANKCIGKMLAGGGDLSSGTAICTRTCAIASGCSPYQDPSLF